MTDEVKAGTQPDDVEQTDNLLDSDTGENTCENTDPEGGIKQPDEQKRGTRKHIPSPEQWCTTCQQ